MCFSLELKWKRIVFVYNSCVEKNDKLKRNILAKFEIAVEIFRLSIFYRFL